jgi:chromosome partitioning protein
MRLAVCSSKGGVGKTTVAANLAVALARHGRVLAVDVDPQDSLGRAFGVVAKTRDDSLAALLEDPLADPRSIIRCSRPTRNWRRWPPI